MPRLALPASPLNRGRFLIFTAAVLWSLGGFFIKEIDAGASAIVLWRCLFAALILLPLMRFNNLPTRGDAAVSIVLFALLLGLYVGSTKATTAANAIFLQYTAPLYVIALGPMLIHERLRRADALPFIICLSGIVVLFAGNQGDGDATGLWLGAGSGLFYGIFFLWLRRMRYANPVAITFINCVGVVVIFAFIPASWHVDSEDLVLLFIMAAVQFTIPYVLFTKGIQTVPAAESSLIALIEPVLNPVWVALFYGEDPTTATVIGGAVIITGLALRYTVFRSPNEATAPT